MLPPLRLRDDLGLSLRYADRTPCGSAVSGLVEVLIARTCAPLSAVLRREGPAGVAARSAELVARALGPAALGVLYEREDALREEVLHPRPDLVTPAALRLDGLGPDARGGVSLPLAPALAGELARWIGEWSRGAPRPRQPGVAALWDALLACGALTGAPASPRPASDGVTFAGHATVLLQSAGTRVVVDPFVVPRSPLDPPDARPYTAADLRPDAVLITHSHPDHYDLGALLRFGADTEIYVPEVPRESLLAIDMAARLRELGFTRAQVLPWHAEAAIGPFVARALPFYGEQPTDGEVLHPEARNAGNTYLIDGPCGKVALVADAGRDAAGDTRAVGAAARARFGAADVLFGGYRAWLLRPAQYLFTSVARYLLFVPRARWGAALQVMNGADDLLDAAAAFGARAAVPYANGGAPWYARIGLGHGEDPGEDDPDFDPSPAVVAAARARRGEAGARVLPLRPGERLDLAPAT